MAHDGAGFRLTAQDGTVIAAAISIAESPWARFVGLMVRRELAEGHGICIRPCNSIHMFFMRFPIDAVFVDRDGKVLRIYASIKPWRATWFVPRAKACIELPAGTCAAANVAVGDTVVLQEGAGEPTRAPV